MAADPINIIDRRRAVQYDGTNSGDIIALDEFDLNNSSVDGGGVWTFQSPPDSTLRTIAPDDWVVYSQNAVNSNHPPGEFNTFYECNTTCPEVEAFASFASEPKIQAMGIAPVPPLTLNQTADVDVTLQPALADDTYDAYAHLFAGVSLSNLQINSVTVVDGDTVTVAVQNTGVATLSGASVLVHAVA